MKLNLSERVSAWVTKHPWWILLLTLSIVTGLSYGVQFLGFRNDYQVYFSQENPQLRAFEAIQKTYNKSDNVMFVIETLDGNVFTKKTLQSIAELTKKAWFIPYSSRVDSITNFQHTVAEEDDLLVGDLVPNPDNLSAKDLAYIKQVALKEPLLVSRLISRTGHVAGVSVTVQMPRKKPSEPMEIAAKARELVSEITAQNPNLRIYLTGMAMMNNAFAESALKDNKTLVPTMYAVVIFTLLISLRSFSAVFAVILTILFSIVVALGIAGWFKADLTPTSAISPTIILTMAVADCVHLLVTFLHLLRSGKTKKESMQESLRINFQPIFLTTLTTTIGFLSMNFSDAPPFRDLGNIVALGVAFAWLFSITFLPALMVLLPVKVKVIKEKENSFMSYLAQFTIRYRKTLLWVNGLVVLVLGGFAPINQLNDEFIKYFDETTEFRQGTDFFIENLGGLYNIELAVSAGTEGGISEPEFLNSVQRFGQWLLLQPEAIHLNTITDTFKRLNKNMHADDPAWYRLPEERDLAAQYLLLYEMSLPYGLDLNDQINIDKSGVRLIFSLKNMSSNEIIAIETRIQDWLARNEPKLSVDIASPVLMFAHIGKRNIIRMVFGTIAALILISFILILAFKSLKLGLLSLIPNLAPAAVAFGLWGIIDGQVGLGLSVVTGMTLGVVVDDTVHFISKYRRARYEKNLSPDFAVHYAFSTVGVALWVTSFVLVCGFVVMTFSPFVMNSDMGLMTAMTIAMALLLDLLLLPPLLITMEKKQ